MRVRADDVRVHERRALSLPRIVDGALHRAAWLATRSQPSTSSTYRPGNDATSLEIEPPAVFTSTGTEIA